MDDIGARRLIAGIILQAVKDVNDLYKKTKADEERGMTLLRPEDFNVLEFFSQKNSWASTLLSFQGLDVLPKEFQEKLNYLSTKRDLISHNGVDINAREAVHASGLPVKNIG